LVRRPEAEASKKIGDDGGEIDFRAGGLKNGSDEARSDSGPAPRLLNSQSAELEAISMSLQPADSDNLAALPSQPEIVRFHSGIVQPEPSGQTDNRRHIRASRFSDPHDRYYNMGGGEFDKTREPIV